MQDSDKTWSALFPPEELTRGCIVRAVPRSKFVVLIAEVISALSCMPKTSVRSFIGSFSSMNYK